MACYTRPSTVNEARFSLTFVVATALTYGSLRLAAYEPERLDDPVTRSLMERVSVPIDLHLDAVFPGQRAERLVIETRDSRRLEHLQPNRKSALEEPLNDLELEGKFLELASPVLGVEKAESFVRRLWTMETLASI